MDLAAHLAACDERYTPDAQMLGAPLKSAGYHTTLPDGTLVHGTRGSLDYALALLASGDAAHAERADAVVRKVLSLQDTDPARKTYGIWPYFLEESLDQMSPPDWNWADFCGAVLLMVLADHAARLADGLVAAIRTALRHASEAIIRRDVQPGYTNIAIMGAGVTLAAGELLDDARILGYGRQRLAKIVQHTDYHGGFNEYNSPTYTMVALHECERILQLVRDPAARADAETLRRVAWTTIADHFHPATGQWAGPHSRAYSDLLRDGTVRQLVARTSVAIGGCRPDDVRHDYAPLKPLPCPADLVARFRALPQDPLLVRRRFFRRDTDDASTWGTTWFARDACLGTVNHDTLWTQRHPLVTYATAPDGVAVLRLRFLHDGKDFASACIRNAQDGPRVLSLVGLVTNQGDWHCHLDRPADATFEAEDFRLRYELAGPGATATALGDGRFALAAPPFRVVIHTAHARFDGNDVTWELSQEEGKAYLDAVCYAGSRRAFHLPGLGDTFLACGLDVAPDGAEATLDMQEEDGQVAASWALPSPLTVAAPSLPQPR